MKNVLISVIVPVYNVTNYIDSCVESIVNQTYPDLHILLIDDGSTDDSAKKCDDWCRKDDRIEVIHKENKGVSSARNFGIEKAKGDYLFFVDSDDYLPINAIENLIKKLNSNDVNVVIGNYYKVNSKNEIDTHVKSINKSEDLILFLADSLLWEPWGKLIKKDYIKNLFNENIYVGEDLLFFVENFSNSKFNYVNEPCYYYRYNSNSIMNKKVVNIKNITEFDAIRNVIDIVDKDKKNVFMKLYCNKVFIMKFKYDDRNKIFEKNKGIIINYNKVYLHKIIRSSNIKTIDKIKLIIKYILVVI